MIKKWIVVSILILSVSSLSQNINNKNQLVTVLGIGHQSIYIPQKKWNVLKTIAHASAIGTATGLLGYTINDFFFPFNWLLLYKLRSVWVDAVVQHAHENNEYVNADSLFNTAWITDWIVYLAAFGIQHKIRSKTRHQYHLR